MFIKEIILDGFKSYQKRTEVRGFDPNFNAITGLNGSGKSNILDAICFVLGITNMAQVRVGSLQQLIYKHGNAGVTRASVTIKFDNQDKSQSPVGYAQFDEISVTRQVAINNKGKYLINGHAAQQNRVQNLFHSVQLNVNNPHFLIMQGRITKVLNMKPEEILGMIEETAGTRMFEKNKQNALKTITKKESKVQDIQTMIENDITPRLEKLRGQRKEYMTWLKNQNEMDSLSRYLVAYHWYTTKNSLQKFDESESKLKEDMEQHQETLSNLKQRTAEIDAEVKALKQKRDEEMKDKFKDLEENTTELSKELVKLTTSWNNKKDTLSDHVKSIAALEKSRQSALKNIEKTQAKLEASQGKLEKLREKRDQKVNEFEEAERRLQAAVAGIRQSDGDENDKTWADQLMDAKRMVSMSASEQKQAEMKIKHMTAELAEKKKEGKSAGKELSQMQANFTTLEKGAAKLLASMNKLGCNPEEEEELLQAIQDEESAIQSLGDEVNVMSAKLSGLQFQYSNPTKNFDRSKVKGLVAGLVSLKDEKYSTALEVTAGGKLYNVVVDTEQTGKALLKNGKLKKRVTIIPLNKIKPYVINKQTQQHAAQVVGPNNATTALSLIGYQADVDAAMKYVFGSAMVCSDSKAAKEVAFNPQIKSKSVTLEGDVFDPSGTLTGGARRQAGSVLKNLQKLNMKKEALHSHKQKLQEYKDSLRELRSVLVKFSKLQKDYELKSHEAELLKARIEQNPQHKLLQAIQDLEESLKEEKASIQRLKKQEREAAKKVLSLEKEIETYKHQRDAHLKEAEQNVKKLKALVEKVNNEYQSGEEAVETLEAELEELKEESERLKEEISSKQAAELKIKDVVSQAEALAAAKKAEFDEASGRLEEAKSSLHECEKEIGKLRKEQDSISKRVLDHEVELKKITSEINKSGSKKEKWGKTLERLQSENDWIQSEEHLFGKPGTSFDFEATNTQEADKRMNALVVLQDKLGKSINRKVMSMFETAEEKYQSLKKKRDILEKDKQKIQDVIADLDDKKNAAIKTVYEKVNRDFGAIFSTLLPGTNAKLVPVNGDILQGLEVKVAFADIWKEGLSELSGGQRSLLALSLILSMLLFKPAPMYILDEVDAALDLSHTQNIGQMLKNHFSTSQFIVVSLKEGMFNNANVLFKTSFENGVSQVTRTVPSKRPSQRKGEEEGGRENRAGKGNKTASRRTKAKKLGANNSSGTAKTAALKRKR